MIYEKFGILMLLTSAVLITGCTSNQPPNAQAGSDQTVEVGGEVTLNGSASDPDGVVRTYRWEQVDGPPVSISNADQASASFVAPIIKGSQVATFRLTAADDKDATATDEVVVTIVGKPNQPPDVQAGPDQTVDAGDKMRLRGSASDPDGAVRTYRWEQVDGPPVSISNADQASAFFPAPEVKGSQVATFRLTVEDDNNATASDEMVVKVMEYGRLGVTLTGTVKNHSTYEGIPRASIAVGPYHGGVSRKVGVAKTSRDGRYSVRVRVSPGRLTVSATAAGFAPQSIVVDVSDGSARSADLAMVSVDVTRRFRPEDSAEIDVKGQTVVSLSANALVADGGAVASGEATAMVTVLDASKDPSVMPGDLERWNADSEAAEPIESFGAMNVEFTAANGKRLNLADGRQARISIPLAAGRRPEDSPKSMPLYYWSHATGYWVEEGEAVLEKTADGKWAYAGSVGHFSTWNADVAYESITMKGCVQDRNGKPVKDAEVTARGKDYVGSSKATTGNDGRFEIEVRPESELELSAAAAGPVYSDARTMHTRGVDLSLSKCLVVTGDRGIQDFGMKIKGATGTIKVCVRDHECEDGDEISVDFEGRTIFSGEIDNDWVCKTLKVRGGESYAVELTALNGTGYKGDCSYADGNTGEIRVTGENTETQVWRHRGGAGSRARIIVETARPRFPMPEMVVIPGGRFRMGSNKDYTGGSYGVRSDDVHSVSIESFDLSKYEVTFEEYDAFTDATGRERVPDAGWGRGRRPVIRVSWNDAVAYTQWLSSQTGERYRLPSEAEWEYAARAGTATNFYWGNHVHRNRSNCRNCGSQWDHKKTAPVGSFSPNAWGLHDMHGNVWEWVQDCNNYTYDGAPTDGSAWESGECSERVLRGGSWSDFFPTSWGRKDDKTDKRSNNLGFRVARTVTP